MEGTIGQLRLRFTSSPSAIPGFSDNTLDVTPEAASLAGVEIGIVYGDDEQRKKAGHQTEWESPASRVEGTAVRLLLPTIRSF